MSSFFLVGFGGVCVSPAFNGSTFSVLNFVVVVVIKSGTEPKL